MKKRFPIGVLLCSLLVACGSQPTQPVSSPSTTAPASNVKSTESPKPDNNPKPAEAPKPDNTSKPLDVVKVGTLGVFGDSAIYLAVERGYFKEQGIQVDIQKFAATPELITALGTAKIDAGDAPANAALYNMIGSKIDIKLIAGNVTSVKGKDGGALVIAKSLKDTIRNPSDLKGKKIGVAAVKGSSSQLYIEKLLAPEELTLNDVEFVGLTFADMPPALSNGAIHAGIMPEPFLSSGITQNISEQFRGNGEMFPGQEANLLMFTGDFAKKQDIANRFNIARLKGARDYNDAFFKNIGRDKAINVLTQQTAVKDAAAYANINFAAMHPDGTINPASLEEEVQWYTKAGIVTSPIDIKKSIDNSFNEHAVKTLGPYAK